MHVSVHVCVRVYMCMCVHASMCVCACTCVTCFFFVKCLKQAVYCTVSGVVFDESALTSYGLGDDRLYTF